MYLIRIEHDIKDYNEWKKLFDRDPINRQKSGVQQYRIMRPVDNEKFVIIDLEFDDKKRAESAYKALRELWKDVEGKIIFEPKTSLVEVSEMKKY